MSDRTDIAVRPESDLVPIEEVRKYMHHLENVKKELLVPDDMPVITTVDKKTGKKVSKPYIKRSGWRKIAFAFALSDRIVSEKRTDRPDGSFVWHVVVEVATQSGRTCTGSGACDSKERGYAHVEHDVYAVAHTRAKNRAISDMVAGGVLSAEEMEAAPVIDAEDTDDLEHEFEEDTRTPDEQPLTKIEIALMNAKLDPTAVSEYPEGNRLVVKPTRWIKDDWGKYNDCLKGMGFTYNKEKKQWERGE